MKFVSLSARPAFRRLFIAGAFVLTFAAGTLANSLMRDHDPKLDLAMDNLVKAQALLEATDSGELSKHNQKTFDKQLGRALQAVDDAMSAVNAARDAADGGH